VTMVLKYHFTSMEMYRRPGIAGNEGARLTVTPLTEGGRRTEKVIVLKVGLRTASGNERSPGDRDSISKYSWFFCPVRESQL
jgi:hypothetical protein